MKEERLRLMKISLCLLLLAANFLSGFSQIGQKRLALVIGNGNYLNSVLANPENDARSMKYSLQKVGFEVLEYENLSQSQMKKVMDEFGERLKNFEVGLFFYAGHGIQAKGYNYLIPVDASLKSEEQVEYDCVQADRILALMEASGAKINIMILDACRNNPFERSWTRSATGRGLAFMNAPRGSLIAYSTSPGSMASDGSGSNSIYTSALLESIQIPNITILQMFQNVRSIVINKSNKQQIPWESTSLEGDLYLLNSSLNTNETTIGEIKPLIRYGSIELTTEITGSLFLDGKYLGEIQANNVVPISKIPIGNHLIEIKGGEYWNLSSEVTENSVVSVTSKSDLPDSKLNTSYAGDFIDLRDNRSYNWIKIGDLIWMKNNLNYKTTTGNWCYNDDPQNCDLYGTFYKWDIAKNACPVGWRLPTAKELIGLFIPYGKISYAGDDDKNEEVIYSSIFGTYAPESTSITFENITSDKDLNIVILDEVESGNSRTMFWSSDTKNDRAYAIFFRKAGKYVSYNGVHFSSYPKSFLGQVRCVKSQIVN